MDDQQQIDMLEDDISDKKRELRKRWNRIEEQAGQLEILLEANKTLENACRTLQEELTHVHKSIKDALDLVKDTDQYECGSRAMMAFKVLEGIIEEEEE